MSILKKLSTRINEWVGYSLFVFGVTMTALVAAQVFSRYALNHSLFWSEELARYILVWLTFLGATTAYYNRMHPGVDILYKRLPEKMKKSAIVLVHAASIGLFGIMIISGSRFAWFVRHQITPALSIPKWVVLGIIPFSGLVLLIHALGLLAGDIKEKSSRDA